MQPRHLGVQTDQEPDSIPEIARSHPHRKGGRVRNPRYPDHPDRHTVAVDLHRVQVVQSRTPLIHLIHKRLPLIARRQDLRPAQGLCRMDAVDDARPAFCKEVHRALTILIGNDGPRRVPTDEKVHMIRHAAGPGMVAPPRRIGRVC